MPDIHPDIHPVRAARRKAGLTQAALAAAVGVTKASVSAWEKGRNLPTPDTARRLCAALPQMTFERIYAQPSRRGLNRSRP